MSKYATALLLVLGLAACANDGMTGLNPPAGAQLMMGGAGASSMAGASAQPPSAGSRATSPANPSMNANDGMAGAAPMPAPNTSAGAGAGAPTSGGAGAGAQAGTGTGTSGSGPAPQGGSAGSADDPFDFDPFAPTDPNDPNDPFAPGPAAPDNVVPGYEPHPDNPPECPKAAPEDPVGSCIGVPIYAVCAYGESYTCLCDWVHWLCAG